ncbi:MAG: hypothetical protein E4H14_02285 [Candidatus Thorarchaeota archaeon]|nr:MAG: hypothetical protein E4H14_02285 [Candidatus Thorarchaeota archaeon]
MLPESFCSEKENDDRKIRMESLGRLVNERNRTQFERMLREARWSGVIDITGWTPDAVKALMTVCADEKQSITIKHESRYFMPIRFPRKSMLDSFVEAIISGEF